MGKASHCVASWFSGIAASLGSACASVFHGLQSLLSAIFSWETLLWFLAAGGLIGFAVVQNHPGAISNWIDRVGASDLLSPRIAFVAFVPLLFVLIAAGRMRGVHWHSRQMGAVGLVLLTGGLVMLTYFARSSAALAPPQPVAIAEAVDLETMQVAIRPESPVAIAEPMGAPVDQDSQDIAVQVADSQSHDEAAEPLSPEEAPGEIQADEPVGEQSTESPPSSDEDQQIAADATEELEVVQIQVIDETGQSIDVDRVPEWVELARGIDRRTIAADTQWHDWQLAVWKETTPDEAQEYAPTGTMLYGEVATLLQNSSQADYVVSVSHVGSLAEGEKFADFAVGRIACDRLYEFYPQVRGWSAVGRVSLPNSIVERCVETSMLHVGEFEVPVYTYHAKVHIDSTGEAAVISQWHQHEQYERLVMGGIGIGGIAWLLAIVAAYLRINVATAGRHRIWLKAGALACLVAPLAALFFMRGL